MRRVGKFLLYLFAFLVVAGIGFGLYLSHDGPCSQPAPLDASAAHMRAVTHRCYGGPDVLRVEDIAKPLPGDNDVLVRVHAAAINPFDWHFYRGVPYPIRLEEGIGAPKQPHLGVDFAGTIEAVGKNVTHFKVGDDIYGFAWGAFGQYVVAPEDSGIALKPAHQSFEEAAAMPIAATTALQGLRDSGHLVRGNQVLINGASGGVGTYAVQIAHAMGAEVTAVCSAKSAGLVKSLGADHVIDYAKEDFTKGSQRYDIIFDTVVNHGVMEVRHALKPDGRYVLVGGGGVDANPWFGAFSGMIDVLVMKSFVKEQLVLDQADINAHDLTVLSGMVDANQLRSPIDHTYTLDQITEAMKYLETGHAHGKVVIHID